MSLFELNNVKMHYSTGQRVINALNGINVSFEKGVNIIYGKSGSGKSTLLHVMAGFEEYAVRKGENLEDFDPESRDFGKKYIAKENENQSKTSPSKYNGQLTQ